MPAAPFAESFHSFIRHAKETNIFCRCAKFLRCRRALLPERMGAGEGIDLLACIGDTHDVGKRREIHIEELRAGDLAGEADIRERYVVAMTEAAGFRSTKMGF